MSIRKQVIEEEVFEVGELDQADSIQRWAMQSPDWKLLNVIFDTLSKEQLHLCTDETKLTIFEDIAIIIELALQRPYDGPLYKKHDEHLVSASTQVRQYIINFLIPSMINKSIEFVTPKLSLIYMKLIEKARAFDEHLKDWKETKPKHYLRIQELHVNLLQAKAAKFDVQHVDEYDEIFTGICKTFKNIKHEKLKY